MPEPTVSVLESPAPDQGSSPTAREGFHSANSGLIVERVGRLPANPTNGAGTTMEMCGPINDLRGGLATVVVYEEAFGPRNGLHWLLHVESLDAYETFQWEAGPWQEIVVENETALIPQSFGMYGTADRKPDTVVSVDGETVERFAVPTAAHQASQSPAAMLHSANCGALMHRTGELKYEFRAEGRQFARALTESWNESLAGYATIFLYEEAFGLSDRIHWLIHLRSLGTYYNLMGLRARTDPRAREVFTKQWIPEEKGGGGWERMFVQGSLRDKALVPHMLGGSPRQPPP